MVDAILILCSHYPITCPPIYGFVSLTHFIKIYRSLCTTLSMVHTVYVIKSKESGYRRKDSRNKREFHVN